MRSLFILLVVINFSYLIWGVAFSEKNETSKVLPQIQGEQSLTLLSELADGETTSHDKQQVAKVDKAHSDSLKSDKNLSPSMASAKTCYSLGPILDEEDSNKLEKKLKEIGFKPKHKAITDKEPKSYWVYFPSEKTLVAAKAVVSQLQDANVDDYFIIRKGKFTHAISLGLFNSYSRAKLRVKKLKKLGFDPKIQTRYKDVTRHWLDFQETDSKRLNTRVWENVQKDNPLQKLARACEITSPKSAKPK